MIVFLLLSVHIKIVSAQSGDTIYFNQQTPVIGRIVNTEVPIASTFTTYAKIYLGDTVTIDSLSYILPTDFIISNATNIVGTYYPFDSITLCVSIQNNNYSNLPFYPCEFSCKVNYTTHSSSSNTELVFMSYYTPYNTIEIWDVETFYSLPRKWLNPKDNPNATRIYVAQSSIPQTDIVDFSIYEPNSTNWNDWRFDNFREYNVDGLAYTVLMKPIPNDSIAYYDAIEDDSIKIEGNRSRIFTGTVTGRITAETRDGTGIIGLAGLRVELRERDGIWPLYWYQNFGITYTDEDGYYTIQYDESQANTEGSNIELYLRISAIDNNTYKVLSNNLLGITHTYQERLSSYGTNAGTITKNIAMADSSKYDAYRCVHWVRNGCMYFDNNTICPDFRSGIRIRTNCVGNYSDNYAYSNYPTIHIKRKSGKYEGTVRHEFGHTAMYFLQNRHMKIPYGAYGVNHHPLDIENTSLLAFYEGWANFVAAILDAVYYQEDNEYGKNHQNDYEDYELNYLYGTIGNGFRSEYNIMTALYDLWDGPDKGIPQIMTGYVSRHGWNDSYHSAGANNWNSIDDVELSLSEICAPLKTVTSDNKLDNMHCIQQYIDTLLFSNNTSCQYKRDVIRVFRENRVVWNIDDYNNNKSLGNLSIDSLFTNKCKNEVGHFLGLNSVNSNVLAFYELPWSPVSWTDIYQISGLNENATNNWNFCPNTSAEQLLIDDYLVGYYDPSDNRFTNMNLNTYNNYNVQNANFTTCGDDNVIKVRNGTLTLGSLDGTYKANLTISNGSLLEISDGDASLVVNDGSVLTISQGGTLCVKEKGKIIVRGNGRIEVEDGAYICISSECNYEDIILQASNSIINIAENAIVGINPIHNTTVGEHSCNFPCDMVYSGYGSINCACGFGIFDYNNDYIVSESETLTGTKKFRQNVIIPNGVTLTLNNSTFEMKDNKSIIINAGGKLVVDHSTITNSSYCPSKMWKGIRVLGNKNQQQLATNQGTVEIKNGSVISNAKDAISTWDGDDYNSTGGIVKCTNSTFTNNRRCAEFMAYTNHDANNQECNNVSYFKDCDFIINDANIFSSAGVTYSDMITMWGVNGIAIRGCHFSDNRTGLPTRGNAITLAGAGVNIKPSCAINEYNINTPCTCLGESSNTFYGFTKGVKAENTGTNYPFYVFKTNFSLCEQSVYSSAVNNYEVTMSNFNLSGVESLLTIDSYGLYSSNSTGYKIEGNSVYTTNTTPVFCTTYGIYMAGSGTSTNTIYRNTFNKLDYGIYTSNNPGLQVSCNELSNIFNTDIYVVSSFPFQGTSSSSAGNKFTSGATNINSGTSFWYFYSGTANTSNPYYPASTTSNVTKRSGTANNCTPTICTQTINPKSVSADDDIALYDTLQQMYESRLAEYNAAGYGFLLENFNENEADIVAVAMQKHDTLVSLSSTMAEIANRNMEAIFKDTVMFDREALNGWYNRINTTTAKYSLVNSYFEVGNYDLARQELASIPQRFVLSNDELAEYDNFCQYQSLRESVYSSGRNYAQLTEDEIAELQTIVERNTGVSSAYANSALCFFYGICREDEKPETDDDAPINSKSTTAVAEESTETEPIAIYVYPNPTENELNILLNTIPEGKTMIEFHDVTGRLVLSEEIKGNSTSINISSLKQGVYMYRIVNGDNVIARDRIVKE